MPLRWQAATTNPNISGKLWSETLGNEQTAFNNSLKNPAARNVLPPPMRVTQYLESSGLGRSLSTNIPDHPTAIQVNGLRMERVEGVVAPGYVEGVGSYDARVLCGNWSEERCDKHYKPSERKAATGRAWQWETTYEALSKSVADKVRPSRVSNAVTMYTDPASHYGTGVLEESASSNKETIKLGGIPGVDYIPGDPRSASRPPGNSKQPNLGSQP